MINNIMSVEINGEIFTIRAFGKDVWVWSTNDEVVYFEDEIISGVLDIADGASGGKLLGIKKIFSESLNSLRLALEKYKKLSVLA